MPLPSLVCMSSSHYLDLAMEYVTRELMNTLLAGQRKAFAADLSVYTVGMFDQNTCRATKHMNTLTVEKRTGFVTKLEFISEEWRMLTSLTPILVEEKRVEDHKTNPIAPNSKMTIVDPDSAFAVLQATLTPRKDATY
ncbi:Hypothetical predicted protein [Olea europaea subsp. europaea]|uniref:Uncharacterized protein n=1 Tax=Olea europaea subsp. europaea TaxID=158383 RepID=A0A8S0PZP4_OLEEU|nr:Hypothetical predicted protein [Olea europaea subsp. europaea]